MTNSILDLPDNRADITEIILADREKIKRLETENRLLRLSLFGPKSEKLPPEDSPQLLLFDMPEPLPADDDKKDDGEVVVPAHIRRKSGRKPLPANLPRVEIVHDIPDDQKVCPCGCSLSRIGEDTSEKLDIIPAKIQVIVHVRPKYACKECEGISDDKKSVKVAPPPPQIIPKGLATAGLLAHILVAKFCDGLPFYRQEGQFIRLGIDITRQSMSNWAMKACEACKGLMDLLHEDIRGGPVIHADETTVQVLREPDRAATQKSYMWVFRGESVVIYQYQPSRSGDVAKLFLGDYKGVVQTDGYAGYNFLDTRDDVLHVGCWAHVRRKFYEAKKANGTKSGSADKALSMIQQLYRLEKKAKDKQLNADDIKTMRQRDAKKILNKMLIWLEKRRAQVLPKSLLGKAINYGLNQWTQLVNYIENGHANIDNNLAENSIRPFVIGRKNWLFAGSPAGARASASLYSLIETAKANNLEPYGYLRFLFERLPTTPNNQLRKLLPSNLKPTDLSLPTTPSGI